MPLHMPLFCEKARVQASLGLLTACGVVPSAAPLRGCSASCYALGGRGYLARPLTIPACAALVSMQT